MGRTAAFLITLVAGGVVGVAVTYQYELVAAIPVGVLVLALVVAAVLHNLRRR